MMSKLSSKLKTLQRIKQVRLEIFLNHFKLTEKNAISDCSNMLVALNASFDCGINGEQLKECFEDLDGFERLEMFLAGTSFSWVFFHSSTSAMNALDYLDGLYQPTCKKQLLFIMTNFVPEFPERPLTDPTVVFKTIPGMLVLPNFCTSDEEEKIIEHIIIEGSNGRWQSLKSRTVQHYSFKFDYSTKSVNREQIIADKGLPEWVEPIIEKYMERFENKPLRPNQLTLNRYDPGGGIPFHVDTHSSFLSPLLILSLGSQTVMDFRISTGDKYTFYSVLLPRRSLVVMDGESRYAFEHCIRPRKMDLIDGLAIVRSERFSLTFRNIRPLEQPCSCSYKSLCT